MHISKLCVPRGVCGVWNFSFLASSDSRNTGEGLSSEKAPKDGAPWLEGLSRVDVTPGDKCGSLAVLGEHLDGHREFSNPNGPVFPEPGGWSSTWRGGCKGRAQGWHVAPSGQSWRPCGVCAPQDSNTMVSTGLSWIHEPAPTPRGDPRFHLHFSGLVAQPCGLILPHSRHHLSGCGCLL